MNKRQMIFLGLLVFLVASVSLVSYAKRGGQPPGKPSPKPTLIEVPGL